VCVCVCVCVPPIHFTKGTVVNRPVDGVYLFCYSDAVGKKTVTVSLIK
jgi:hypothetical protein